MPITEEQAWNEAVERVPAGQVRVRALEIYNPVLGEPIRYVNDNKPLEALIEADAPRNVGEVVTFQKGAFRSTEPTLSTEANIQNLAIQVVNVGKKITTPIIQGALTHHPTTIILRDYIVARAKTGGPADKPYIATVSVAPMDNNSINITATMGEFLNDKVPAKTINTTDYPGFAQ